MYASDLTHRKRAAANFRNLQLQKDWFATGQTIRILGQKGGNDYAYMAQLEEGCIQDKCWQLYIPIAHKSGDGSISDNINGMIRIPFTSIYDSGYGSQAPIPGILDDSFIRIPMGGMDFFFNGVNYAELNQISWNSNNILIFGPEFIGKRINLNSNVTSAILMGNYDRLCSSIYYVNYTSSAGFYITKFIVSFSNYYTDNTELSVGKLQVRLIKERYGNERQWVEVGVISSVPSPGYSNNPSVSYPSGVNPSGNPIDSSGDLIDPTKNSPWDITNGSQFLQVAGNTYSTEFPAAGTTILYEGDKQGIIWSFRPNAHLPI